MTTPPDNTLPQPPNTVEGIWRHSRFYGTRVPDKYLFPIDAEELSRLDLMHKFFLVARNDKLCQYDIVNEDNIRIMDLGTGTGIWPISLAQQFPLVEIMAVDFNQIQPQFIPPNLRSLHFDLEEPSWEPLLRDCNLVHTRLLFGSLETDLWPDFYKKVFAHMSAGDGYFEQLEIDWSPCWDGEEVPETSVVKEWSDHFLDGLDRANRSARVQPQRTKRWLEEAGFTDIKEEIVKCPTSPWPKEKVQKDVARWFNLGLFYGMEAMSLSSMVDHGNLHPDEVRDLCERAKTEMCVLRYCGYMKLYIWTARKPEDKKSQP